MEVCHSPNARIYGSEPLGSIEKDEFCYLCRRMFLVMVSPFEKLKGVINVVSGYTGGHTKNPTYEEVCSGTTGHFEAVQITFDPNRTSYDEILDIFWQQLIQPIRVASLMIEDSHTKTYLKCYFD